jgi:adenine-specific DNA methylase
VDAVVTDPPYESNVMYSELSNFFYVWLRLSLRSRYPWFADDVVPWEREVISNRVQNKGHREYLDGLTQVFRECHRVLKGDGVMTFTFHHMNPRAWGSVLQALLNAGFVVSCVWPAKSEMDASTHLRGLNSMHYDSVVVCRKRTACGPEADWGELMDEIREVSEMQLRTLRLQGLRFSASDALVVVLGNSFRIYSSHYPNVVNQGVPVDTEEALCTVARLAQTEWRSGLLLEGEK